LKIVIICKQTYIGLCRIVVAKPETKMRLGRPRLRLEDNIKMDLLILSFDSK
jgi:hypothetical protein